MKKAIIFLSLIFLSAPLVAKETDSTTLLIGGGDGMQRLANRLAELQAEDAKRGAYLDRLEYKILQNSPDVNVDEILSLLNNNKWLKQRKRILEILILLYIKKGEWNNAIAYRKQILLESSQSNQIFEQITKYQKLLDQYRSNVPGVEIEDKIPIDELEIQSLRHNMKKPIEKNPGYWGKLAECYMKHLYFSDAEKAVTQRLTFPLPKKGFLGIKTFYEQTPRTLLRNLYILHGRYTEALEQNNWLRKNAPTEWLENNRKAISTFLEMAIRDKIDPERIIVAASGTDSIGLEIEK